MATPAILPEGSPAEPPQAPPSRPPKKYPLWIHAALLAVTFFSTTVIGMRYMANFRAGLFPVSSDADIFPYAWAWLHAAQFAMGLPFSLTLLAILLTHEFGHYFACRAYGIKATLPYVLPAPTLSGTAGAVIRLRSRVNSRAALMAIGAMGPVSGFVVATAMACVGIALSTATATPPERMVDFHAPLLLQMLFGWFHHGADAQHMVWHPIYVASWIGILITSLNLVPAGQLDGGHILYAVSPRAHKYVTWTTMAALAYFGVTKWLGWLLWVGLLLIPGMRHPKVNDPQPLPWKLAVLGPLCLLMFVLCATPEPFNHMSMTHFFERLHHR